MRLTRYAAPRLGGQLGNLCRDQAHGGRDATHRGWNPRQVSKVTLGDVSIDGPAIWTSMIGTNPLHHLNIAVIGV